MKRFGFQIPIKSAEYFFCLIVLTFCFTFNLIGQNNVEDKVKLAITQREKINVRDQDQTKNIEFLNEALKTFKEVENWEQYRISLSYLSTIYYYQKDYENYFAIVPQYVELAKSLHGTSSKQYAFALGQLSLQYKLKGNFFKSIEVQKKSLQILKDYFAEEGILYDLESIGLKFQDIGDYGEALNYFEEALKHTNNSDNRQIHIIARLYRQMGKCHLKSSQNKDALRCYNKSKDILDRLPEVPYYQQTEWYAYQDLSELYLKKNKPDSALYFIHKAIDIQKKTSPLEAYKCYLQLGDVQSERNDNNSALAAYEKAYVLAKDEFSNIERHPSFALSKAKIAWVFQKQGNFSKSLDFYQKALRFNSHGFESNDIASNPEIGQMILKQAGLEILAGKAETLFASYKKRANLKHLKLANKCYLLAVETIKAIRKEYMADGSKHNLAKKALLIYEKAIETSLELFQTTGDKHYLEQAFSFSENNKAVLLFESIRDDIAKGFAGIPDSLVEREYDLSAELNYYQKKIIEEKQKSNSADQNSIKEWENKVFEFRQQYQKLIAFLEKEYPSYYELKYIDQSAKIVEIREKLTNDKTALVEYLVGTENAFVFLLTKNDLQVVKIKEKEKLIERVARLRELISTPPNSEKFGEEFNEFTHLSNNLYNQLLVGMLSDLSPKINRLIIIPDDVLCYLPFEILLRKKPVTNKPTYSPMSLTYLIEDYRISYQYSASLMAAEEKNKTVQAATGKFVGFAPSFKGSYAAQRTCSTDMLYSLQCNKQEVAMISELMEGEALFAERAGLGYFMENASDYRIIHLATHACVDDSDIGLNKIYLSDGDLSQYELNNLRLNADLAVLSACNTGMGKLLKGEGMMSLTRSFMLAGSKSVLTSLWSVDDCATSDIMVNYYKCLKKGMPKDEAIAKAKLAYLKTADRNNSHPYYWAAFVQFGNIESLDLVNHFQWYHLAGILALASLFIYHWNKKKIG